MMAINPYTCDSNESLMERGNRYQWPGFWHEWPGKNWRSRSKQYIIIIILMSERVDPGWWRKTRLSLQDTDKGKEYGLRTV